MNELGPVNCMFSRGFLTVFAVSEKCITDGQTVKWKSFLYNDLIFSLLQYVFCYFTTDPISRTFLEVCAANPTAHFLLPNARRCWRER